jgi:hypothetical protein
MRKVFLLALIFASICPAQTLLTAQQHGSLSGTVTGIAGEPLKSATLTLRGQPVTQSAGAGLASLPPAYAASSDAAGNFVFDDLPPGRYNLSSERAGYLRANYTANSNGPISVLDLTSGQTLTGIAIKMTPQAVISGKITDENGDPCPNVNVQLARWAYVGGQKRLQPSNGGQTNAEGVFAIGNLAAGSYYISAISQPVGQRDAIEKGPQEIYVTTYYPGVIEPSGAIAVQVTAGAVARGAEIRMRKARAFRVRGKLAGPASETASPNRPLRLIPKDGPSLGPQPFATVRDGSFDFERVLPGVYILEAMQTRPGEGGVARQVVTVGNADVDDLVLSLAPGAEITGTISTEGPVPPPQPQQQSQQQDQQPGMPPGFNARPSVVITMDNGASRAQTNDDGTFAIHNVMPGVYRVQVQPLPLGTYIKSIRFGSLDLSKTPLDLTSGSGGTLNVVLSPNAGDVSGIVHGADGMPAVSVLVSLWTPGVPAEGVTDFTRTAQTDANGQFKFASLPPGDYRIAAWEQIDPGLSTIPEFRIKFESNAAAVKLNENGHENIEAPLIVHDAIEAEAAKLQ